MANGPSGVTRTQQVFDELRGAIVRGDYAPGAPLRLQELSDQYGVSMSVVREALTKLSERHLVVAAPNVGFRVVDVSPEDLGDLVDMRVQFEGLALTRSIERGDLDWAARVISAHYVLENTPFLREDGLGTTDEWAEAHVAFHAALGSACESPRLLAYTRMLRDAAELYRQISGSTGERDRDVAGEHRVLMELATTRQSEAARAALEEHLMRTARPLLGAAAEMNPA